MITVSQFVPLRAGATSVRHGQRKSNNNGNSGLLIAMFLVLSGRGTRVGAPSGDVMLFAQPKEPYHKVLA